jgi:uncharacterized protein YciI
MKIVSFYDLAPGALGKLREHFPAHGARLEDFHARGLSIAAGPLGNPPESAKGIFASREAPKSSSRAIRFSLIARDVEGNHSRSG